MTDYTDLQKAAEYAAQDTIKFADEDEEMRALQQFHEEVSPETVLGLIADLDEARNGMKHSCAIRLKKEVERLESEAMYSAGGFDAAREEIARLKAEVAGLRTGYEAYERVNAELKTENEALRNSSSCVDDLSALVRQLVHRLRKAAPDNDLPEKALDYLKRKGLQGSPLRNEHDDAAEREAQKIYDGWARHDGFVPWVPGGNSLKQDEARRLARAAMGKGEQS